MKRVKQPKNTLPRSLGAGDQIIKKLTLPGITLTTGVAGTFPLTTITAAEVQSVPATEWTSFATRYQQFRVRKIRIRLFPMQKYFTDVAVGTSGPTSGYIATCVASDFIGSASPVSATQCLSDEGSRQFSQIDRFAMTCDWSRNPNARLWNPTSAALPTANSYGIALACISAFFNQGAIVNGSVLFTGNVEWEVEFRGSQ